MAIRSFRDEEGKCWRAWESGRGMIGGGWLWFQSGAVRRQLIDPPGGWSDWPDEALLRLCHAAETLPGVAA